MMAASVAEAPAAREAVSAARKESPAPDRIDGGRYLQGWQAFPGIIIKYETTSLPKSDKHWFFRLPLQVSTCAYHFIFADIFFAGLLPTSPESLELIRFKYHVPVLPNPLHGSQR